MFPLPDGWSEPEAFDDVIVAGGVLLRRAGVAATAPTGEEVVGSAASPGDTHATKRRAWFELAERVSIVQALAGRARVLPLLDAAGRRRGTIARAEAFPASDDPGHWVPARSSGVAIHRDWPSACGRAYAELAERDRVLRAWRGEIAPEEVPLGDPALTASRRYEWRAFALDGSATFAPEIFVAVVAGFPQRDTDPVALGFGARTTLRDAVRAGTNEALQLLAFLWDNEVPARAPARRRPTPTTHLDTFQAAANRPRLRRWLEGGHRRYALRRPVTRSRPEGQVRFVDLGGPWLKRGLRVAKAICDAALPLGFGEVPALRGLPRALRIHPIP